jgi:hypothetical protein
MKVTLFPFLAVLVCLMGAMIMFLVIVARNVRDGAAVNVTNNIGAVETQAQVQDKIAEAEWYSENLSTVQKENEQKLGDLQTQLALVEKETQKVALEIRRLLQLATQFDAQPPVPTERLKQELESQKIRQKQAELELAELQKNAAENKKSYAIIPYRGQNGTYRRPVYIECTGNKVIIQPEGIELTEADFVTANRPDNPFDSVLRVARQYYLEMNQTARGSEAYPLLIVRPSGVPMFAKSLQAVGTWVKDYGYELVNEDWHIEYPEANAELKDRLEKQLDVSRRRMNGYLLAMRDMPGTGGGLRVAGSRLPESGTGTFSRNSDGVAVNQSMPQKQAQQDKIANGAGELMQDIANQAIETQEGNEETQRNRRAANDEGVVNGTTSGAGIASNAANKGVALNNDTPPPAMKVITRTVKVRCEADRFVLVRQAGLPFQQTFRIETSVDDAVDKLVKAVTEYQETWGKAGDGLTWKTILQVRVQSGGEERLRELKERVHNSEWQVVSGE